MSEMSGEIWDSLSVKWIKILDCGCTKYSFQHAKSALIYSKFGWMRLCKFLNFMIYYSSFENIR